MRRLTHFSARKSASCSVSLGPTPNSTKSPGPIWEMVSPSTVTFARATRWSNAFITITFLLLLGGPLGASNIILRGFEGFLPRAPFSLEIGGALKPLPAGWAEGARGYAFFPPFFCVKRKGRPYAGLGAEGPKGLPAVNFLPFQQRNSAEMRLLHQPLHIGYSTDVVEAVH